MPEDIIRLCVGIEDVDDLIDDLSRAVSIVYFLFIFFFPYAPAAFPSLVHTRRHDMPGLIAPLEVPVSNDRVTLLLACQECSMPSTGF